MALVRPCRSATPAPARQGPAVGGRDVDADDMLKRKNRRPPARWRCQCCGQIVVEAVVVLRSPGAAPEPLLRVTQGGFLVGYYRTPAELAARAVDLAQLVAA